MQSQSVKYFVVVPKDNNKKYPENPVNQQESEVKVIVTKTTQKTFLHLLLLEFLFTFYFC